MSNTPRTDNEAAEGRERIGRGINYTEPVSSAFTRQLETELAELSMRLAEPNERREGAGR